MAHRPAADLPRLPSALHRFVSKGDRNAYHKNIDAARRGAVMRRATDVRPAPFQIPRAFRPQGRDLDLTPSEDAANLKRMFAAAASASAATSEALAVAAPCPPSVQVAAAYRRALATAAGRLTALRRVREGSFERSRDPQTPLWRQPAASMLIAVPVAAATGDAVGARRARNGRL
jgi:hypothetical protein